MRGLCSIIEQKSTVCVPLGNTEVNCKLITEREPEKNIIMVIISRMGSRNLCTSHCKAVIFRGHYSSWSSLSIASVMFDVWISLVTTLSPFCRPTQPKQIFFFSFRILVVDCCCRIRPWQLTGTLSAGCDYEVSQRTSNLQPVTYFPKSPRTYIILYLLIGRDHRVLELKHLTHLCNKGASGGKSISIESLVSKLESSMTRKKTRIKLLWSWNARNLIRRADVGPTSEQVVITEKKMSHLGGVGEYRISLFFFVAVRICFWKSLPTMGQRSVNPNFRALLWMKPEKGQPPIFFLLQAPHCFPMCYTWSHKRVPESWSWGEHKCLQYRSSVLNLFFNSPAVILYSA